VRRDQPAVVAFVGITVYRAMFPDRRGPVTMGVQNERLGDTKVFVLPNTSGRNAHYSVSRMLAAFAALRLYVDSSRPSRRRSG
jgi:TDG/mug DNA glycosylase family protein